MLLTLQLLREAVNADEKVLLFSQSLETLEVLEHVLQRTPSPRAAHGAAHTGGWQESGDRPHPHPNPSPNADPDPDPNPAPSHGRRGWTT